MSCIDCGGTGTVVGAYNGALQYRPCYTCRDRSREILGTSRFGLVFWLVVAALIAWPFAFGVLKPPDEPSVRQERPPGAVFPVSVLDPVAVGSEARIVLIEEYQYSGVGSVVCPGGVVVTAGTVFACETTIGGTTAMIPIRITSDSGDFEVGRPA